MKNKTVYPTEKEILVYPAIDWERRRYEIAKEVLPSLTDKKFDFGYPLPKRVNLAIAYADELIKQLKDETKP